MKTKLPLIVSLSIACLFAGETFANNYWSNDIGGDFNIPPKEYNYDFHGYGSRGQTVWNKIDLHNGQAMQINEGDLYDNQGNKVGTAKASMIGYYNGTRDGGIIAGAITKINIGGRSQQVAYAWSVNVEEGGRKSGWMKINNFVPKDPIKDILKKTKEDRLSLMEDSLNNASFVRKTVKEAYLPSEAAEWYLMPGRDASKGAGKAKYYFTRDGLISGLKNIPETGSQRYGVAHDIAPVGTAFYMDRNTDEVETKIYPPSSYTASDYSLKLVFGYFINSSGREWYSWVNSAALE